MSARSPRELLKRVLHTALGDYHYWKVFYIDLPQPPVDLPAEVSIRPIKPEELEDVPDQGMRERKVFGGNGAQGFGLFVDGELAAVQWYWWGERYQAERKGRSWVLPPDAAKSLGLYTRPEFRGRGYAPLLKRHTAHLMAQQGFTRLYSRIWHSHKSSIQVSRKTGWRVAGSYIEICPFSRRIKLRLPL
ncbi:hypothetical protein DFR31_1593 [Alkalispirillum mobile]|uniref:N-acetyltransferase domain-containing protein n=1 Tax=Alkalispirillum mobile TaxID=85925 RepID=A0A498CH40_9GAMM|nr:hypothetical protein DFR31_1593 [Alkalispirillum mobile]